ncbi:MAG: DUF805 domain-containing protein [Sulfobacillus thermotolerans]|nr:DUF805 domain-containing protein [Sulfobacillus thermotolerans]
MTVQWYFDVLKKYAVFAGRAGRMEYWMFVLINAGMTVVLEFIDLLLTHNAAIPFEGLYTLAVFIPGLAVLIRRLHDTGHSGWWLLIAMIPVIGWIVLFVFTVKGSDPGMNDYGPNPQWNS